MLPVVAIPHLDSVVVVGHPVIVTHPLCTVNSADFPRRSHPNPGVPMTNSSTPTLPNMPAHPPSVPTSSSCVASSTPSVVERATAERWRRRPVRRAHTRHAAASSTSVNVSWIDPPADARAAISRASRCWSIGTVRTSILPGRRGHPEPDRGGRREGGPGTAITIGPLGRLRLPPDRWETDPEFHARARPRPHPRSARTAPSRAVARGHGGSRAVAHDGQGRFGRPSAAWRRPAGHGDPRVHGERRVDVPTAVRTSAGSDTSVGVGVSA